MLVDGSEQRAADSGIVEWRKKAVGAQVRAGARFADEEPAQLRIALKQRQQVAGRLLPAIHLARPQGGRSCRGIGDDVPFNTVEMRDLRARRVVGRAVGPRHVVLEPLIDDQRTLHALIRLEAERAASDHLRDLLERISVRQPFGHDDARARCDLAERFGQHRERSFQPKDDSPVIGRRQVVGPLH